MARPLRLEFPGALYHLTARGNARQDIFLDEGDRKTFVDFLAREIEQHDWKCHAYCLMPNHYHLMLETPRGSLVAGMKRLNGHYAQAFNRRHMRVGHLFQGRYKSIVVDRESYLLELSRYIVLNPVRAGLASGPGEWKWSSYRATAGFRAAPAWLHVSDLLSRFAGSAPRARALYRAFVREGLAARSPWNEIQGQVWLGPDRFLARMEDLAARRPLDNVPLAQARPGRPDADGVLRRVSEAYDIPPRAVLTGSHREAFLAGVYLLRRAAGLSLRQVSGLAGISTSWVSQIQSRIESGPPDPRLVLVLQGCKLEGCRAKN